MFRANDNIWYNVGNDRQKDDIISEQNQVTASLGLDWEEYKSFRKLSHYLWENYVTYGDRLLPAIWGQLLTDLKPDLETIYLIGTNQPQALPRHQEKDTLYAAEILRAYCENQGLAAEVISLGSDKINPTDFDQMLQWWQQTLTETIKVGDRPVVLCLKGGIGQTAEAGRIAALGTYGEQVAFYDAIEKPELNRQGIPSPYIGPSLGTNYLWSRVQKQALALLQSHSYTAAEALLRPYFKQDPQGWSATPNLLKGAIAWNQGQFQAFVKLAESALDRNQIKQTETYWWQAYEQAYTAVVRLKQNNTTEAMQHSFRAVEGLLYEWLQAKLSKHLAVAHSDGYLLIKCSILEEYPALRSLFIHNARTIQARLHVLAELVAQVQPATFNSEAFRAWNNRKASTTRNEVSHKLGGISEQKLFQSWGHDLRTIQDWEKRILDCLNQITGKSFYGFQNASLFPVVQYQIQTAIRNYSPTLR